MNKTDQKKKRSRRVIYEVDMYPLGTSDFWKYFGSFLVVFTAICVFIYIAATYV